MTKDRDTLLAEAEKRFSDAAHQARKVHTLDPALALLADGLQRLAAVEREPRRGAERRAVGNRACAEFINDLKLGDTDAIQLLCQALEGHGNDPDCICRELIKVLDVPE